MAGKKRVERRGTRAGKRAVRPYQGRRSDPRRDAALQAARDAEARLNDLLVQENLELERQEIERQLQLGAERRNKAWREKLARAAEREREERQAALKRKVWTLGQARSIVRQGYSIQQAMRLTGYSYEDLEDADRIFE